MAVQTKRGELGKLSGKVGNVVVSKWKSIGVVKTAPGTRVKSVAKAPSSQNVRLKLISKFSAHFADVLKVGFYNRYSKNPAYHQAVEYNLRHAVKGTQPDYEIDFAKVVMSRGTREIPWACKLVVLNAITVSVSWEVPATAKLSVIGKDSAYLVYFNNSNAHGGFTLISDARAKLSSAEILPAYYHNGLVHFWLFFSSPNGKEISNSRYVGMADLSEAVK